MGFGLFDSIKKHLIKRLPLSEDLAVEPALFLIFDPGSSETYTYFLEIRIINTGGVPSSIQTVVCESNDKKVFAGMDKIYIVDGKPDQSMKLEKKGDVLHDNFVLKISSAAQLEVAKPVVFVTTRTGKIFQAAIHKTNIEEIKAFEADKTKRPL